MNVTGAEAPPAQEDDPVEYKALQSPAFLQRAGTNVSYHRIIFVESRKTKQHKTKHNKQSNKQTL